jgi:uncharacterized damage-inducible protein DinB
MIQELYRYHRWANRRLLDVTAALGEDVAAREVGPQFSAPTLKAMFAHIYGADYVWLERWRGTSPPRLPGDTDFATLAEVRERWEPFAQDQQAFVDGLSDAELGRRIDYTDSRGTPYALPLWPLLQHVVNHATHHRSEIATMLTVVSGSPPPTDRVVFELARSGQLKG